MYWLHLFVSIICSIVLTEAEQCSKDKQTPTVRLKKDLLCGYDRTVRPTLNHGNTTKVSVRMVLKSFTYHSHESTLSVNSWLALVWNDEHLVWDPKDYDNLQTIHINRDSIWYPDLSIYNRADQSGDPSALTAVDCLLLHKGNVICIPPTRHEAICVPNLSKYPFDVQNCTLRFGSWVHSGEEIDFKLTDPPVTTDDFVENPEWKLLKVNASKHSGIFKCCPNNSYPTLNYYFTIERHSGSLICMIVVPALGMIFMTLITLVMSPEEMERIALICSNVIFHLLYLQNISWQIPISGAQAPLILVFARDSLLLTIFTLLLTVIQRKLIRTTTQSPMWMSKMVAAIITSRPGQVFFIFDDNLKSVANRIGDEDGANIIENSQTQGPNKDWLIFGRILDKICFISYCIIYLCMFIAFVP
ncbi:PREDICTED: neuronal acetylcholine receptor subunit alpha-5-like [Nicrophorus vespilloides]|uniref:Neuronal acetylcholine receptor subunit alpha-5-like n=1 Tax=Nicrophorus vespilloides TaxID=110193 RepID=A0ABM1MX15_NICVS|nr:PREDICTED: neuronal acetylcholine receptor subunit alpha-5-like [Nicrophorus vespilloides]